ncbi:hypothetical protein [Haloparvum sedimenti]|uniref:hypothetical protein n=1 Tax=Haloparvum sedimenti TaxID=1678448 RepID=UPI00071E943D|nr:hypothetical protein [Haloparvum sedimenti]
MTSHTAFTLGGRTSAVTVTVGDRPAALLPVGQSVIPAVPDLFLAVLVFTLLLGLAGAVLFLYTLRSRGDHSEEWSRRDAEQAKQRAEEVLDRLDDLVDGDPDPEKWEIPRRKLEVSGEALEAGEYTKARQHAQGVLRAAQRNAENAIETAAMVVEDPAPGADRERATDKLESARSALESDRYAEAFVRAREADEAAEPELKELIETAQAAAEAAASSEVEAKESPAAAERSVTKRRESRDAYARALEIAEARDEEEIAERLREEIEDAEDALREAEKRRAVVRIRESTGSAAETADRGSALREDGEYRDAEDAFASAAKEYEQALSVAREHDLSSAIDRIETGLEWTRGRETTARLDAAEAAIDDAAERVTEDPEGVSEEMSALMERLEEEAHADERDERVDALRREAGRVRLIANTERLEGLIEEAESNMTVDRIDTAVDKYESALSAAEKGIDVADRKGFDDEQERLERLAGLCRVRLDDLRE